MPVFNFLKQDTKQERLEDISIKGTNDQQISTYDVFSNNVNDEIRGRLY